MFSLLALILMYEPRVRSPPTLMPGAGVPAGITRDEKRGQMAEKSSSENQRHVTPDMLASYERPTDLDMAADASKIAYVVAPMSKVVDKQTEHGVSTIWVVGALEGEPRQFTGGTSDDASPRWSPDGKHLAFLSDRAKRGESSVYVMPADGGEGVRVFDQDGSI